MKQNLEPNFYVAHAVLVPGSLSCFLLLEFSAVCRSSRGGRVFSAG
jgi:hypothetical protein